MLRNVYVERSTGVAAHQHWRGSADWAMGRRSRFPAGMTDKKNKDNGKKGSGAGFCDASVGAVAGAAAEAVVDGLAP